MFYHRRLLQSVGGDVYVAGYYLCMLLIGDISMFGKHFIMKQIWITNMYIYAAGRMTQNSQS